ncbi:MAG TPA: DUF429 domain-containing protein [Microbacteriaceae bacterium]|nr:DUF429 domain-containing protein [Microbacteriaceae bacterium]
MIVGVDGCRAGWVVASLDDAPESGVRISIVGDLGETASRLRDASLHAVGIDIPIGLPTSGTRSCDVELRAFLGRRASSVFPAPVRAVIDPASRADYAAARATSLAAHGKSLSIQTFNLLPKIAEVDELRRSGAFGLPKPRLIEIHPESAFVAMNDGQPLQHGKKSPAGGSERLALLAHHVPEFDADSASTPRAAAPDDVLDAVAALWSTRRWHAGTAQGFGDGSLDAAGIPMRIWV